MTEPEAESEPPAEASSAETDAAATPDDAATKSDAAAKTDADAKTEEGKPKKKRKKKRAPSAAGAPVRDELDANGRDRPAFLLEFPVHPELERLIWAFENGNYALVREEAPRLIERASEAEVKAAASELLRRIEPDPLLKFMLAVAVALFCAVVGYVYLSH